MDDYYLYGKKVWYSITCKHNCKQNHQKRTSRKELNFCCHVYDSKKMKKRNIIINRYVEDINIWAAMTMCTRQETYGSCINLRRQFSFNFPHINFVKTLNEPLYTHVSAIIT